MMSLLEIGEPGNFEQISDDEKSEPSSSGSSSGFITNGQIPAFLTKLWQMVEQDSSLAKWGGNGKTIIIDEKSTDCLVQFFKTNKIASFIRQLNMYGFSKVSTLIV